MAHYLVFGDLHGRILPAFHLARAYAREHRLTIAGLLQVGDLGYFPDPARLDRATARHAADDALELGAQLVATATEEADRILNDPELPEMWFTAGNHEDFDELEAMGSRAASDEPSFAVDAYLKVNCVRDGHAVELPGGLRVGAIWGIDDEAPGARRGAVGRAALRRRSATQLGARGLDVLISHEGPRGAVFPDSGSEALSDLLREARPAFAFFGHYGRKGSAISTTGSTRLYHLGGMEMKTHADPGSVGLLRWQRGEGTFQYLDPAWLRTFTRHTWAHR